MIKISIIVAVYNASATLVQCLDSLLAQTLLDIEIVTINDGSTDGSQEIISTYLNKSIKISSYYQKNSGLAAAKNTGILKAIGEYIAFVDSDDFVEIDFCEKLYYAAINNNADLVVSSYNRIYKKQQSYFEKRYKFMRQINQQHAVTLAERPTLLFEVECASWLRLIKRSIFDAKELLFTEGLLHEDLEASTKWFLAVDKITVIPERIYNYQINDGSINTQLNIADYIKNIKNIIKYYKENKQFEKYYSELEYLLLTHVILSNLFRLKKSKVKKRYQLLKQLNESMVEFFPNYHKNKYLKKDRWMIRLAIFINKNCPIFYRLLFYL